MTPHNPYQLPADLPRPIDDGAAQHLMGARVPDLTLPCTDGTSVRLPKITETPTVLFFYPRTGVPGQPPHLGFSGENWDDIPGARGCTPQNCAFRDTYAEFRRLGVGVYGVSTQTTEFQREFRDRNHAPFEYLSDVDLHLVRAMRLPTFSFPVESGGPNTLMRRMSWFVFGERIEELWYPVFPPNENAANVLGWLERHLPYVKGVEKDGVMVRRESFVPAEEVATVFAASGIRRPHADLTRVSQMVRHANLQVTARIQGRLVGLARCLSDFSWCCYVSDLAVERAHQKSGIGKALLEAVKTLVGPECTVILSAAPGAETYYRHVGFEPVTSAFKVQRSR